MSIDLKGIKIIPIIVSIVYSFYISTTFSLADMLSLSYLCMALMFVVSLITFYFIIREKTISKQDLLFLAFITLILFSSFLHNSVWKDWFYLSVAILCLLALFHYYRDSLDKILIGLSIGASFAIYLQFIQMIFNPFMWMFEDSKLANGYILGGNYNQIGCRIIYALTCTCLCLRISKWFWLNMIPLLILSIAIPFMVGSMTSVVCILLFIMIFFFPKDRWQRFFITSLLIIIALFQVIVCFGGNGIENNGLAVWFIEEVLGKHSNFTHRTDMWYAGLKLFAKSPIIGFGWPNSEWYLTNMSSQAKGPHNIIIAVMIYGGIVALGIYLALFINAIRCAYNVRNRLGNTIACGIAILSTMMLMEAYPISIILTFFMIANYMSTISKQICGHG